MATDSLPAFEDCLEAYLTAYAAFGDEPFSASKLAEQEADVGSSNRTVEHRLSLLVAYGLLDRLQDDQYRLRCTPDESVTRWQERALERVETVHRHVTDAMAKRRGSTDELDVEMLKRTGDAFASVFVFEREDLESVASTAARAFSRQDAIAGIVLRTHGEDAAHAQRLADQLCAPDVTDRTDLERPLEKDGSDVVGESKDALEFRLFLRAD